MFKISKKNLQQNRDLTKKCYLCTEPFADGYAAEGDI